MSRKSYKTPPSLHPHPNLPSHDGNVVSRRNLSSPPLRVPTPSNLKLASKLPPVHRTPFKHSLTAELMDYSWMRSMRRLTTSLRTPIPVFNVDGTANEGGAISEIADVTLRYNCKGTYPLDPPGSSSGLPSVSPSVHPPCFIFISHYRFYYHFMFISSFILRVHPPCHP